MVYLSEEEVLKKIIKVKKGLFCVFVIIVVVVSFLGKVFEIEEIFVVVVGI